METTPCHVRPYVIPMPCHAVVTTTPIITLPDFAPREIYLTNFHFGDHNPLSIILIQDICSSVFGAGHDWTFTSRRPQSIVILHHASLAFASKPVNSNNNSDSTVQCRMKMQGILIDQKDSIHIYQNGK